MARRRVALARGASGTTDVTDAVVRVAAAPDLVELGVELPVDLRRPEPPAGGGVVRRGQADEEVRHPGGGGLRVAEDELTADGAALLFQRVIDAGHPRVGPGVGF